MTIRAQREKYAASHRRSAALALDGYRRVRRLDFAERFYQWFLAHGNPVGKLAMERLAVLHSRDRLNVPPRLDAPWIECMVQTVSSLDAEWDHSLAQHWRTAMTMCVDLRIEGYDPSP